MGKKKSYTESGKTKKSWVCYRNHLLIIGVSVYIAWLFYDTWWALLLGIIWTPMLCRWEKEKQRGEEKTKRMSELREVLLLLSSYMQVGLSIENAFLETEEEVSKLIDKNGEISTSLHVVNQKVAMSIPVEVAFVEMADAIQMEEGYEFADVLQYAKRLGGNYIDNLRQSITKIEERISLQQEIETMLAEKKLEWKLMVAMPLFIISYIKVTSFDFVESLYHNVVGMLIMTGCLMFYIGMILCGRKILRILV